MKYFRYYETAEDFKDEYYGEKYSEPWLSYTLPQEQVNYNKTDREKALDVPLTFAVKYAGQSGGKIYWKRQGGSNQSEDFCLEYKKNDGEWTEICTTLSGTWPETVTFDGLSGTFEFEFASNSYVQYSNNDGLYFTISYASDVYEGASIYVSDEYGQGREGNYIVSTYTDKTYEDSFIEVSAGDIIQFRGENPYGFFDTSAGMMGAQFTGEDIAVDMYGNFLSIMYGDEDLYSKTEFNEEIIEQYSWGYNGPFEYLFYCMGIEDASGLLLPTNVFPYCYAYFFSNAGVNKAPKLPAMKLERYCYTYMFNQCYSLEVAPELPAIELTEGCYSNMFNECESLENAPTLPATTLAYNCYDSMFSYCISLRNAPSLPALQSTDYCYYNMFYYCINLTKAPALPATALSTSCYHRMFSSCYRLTEAPDLPAMTMVGYCYADMFQDCSGLTMAPALPATTLADHCYYNMFAGCTSLTEAPVLPAETLVASCYNAMFSGCSNLSYIKCLATSATASYYTYEWVTGVSLSGTFEINQNTTAACDFWTIGESGIPYTWSIIPHEPVDANYFTLEALEAGNIGFDTKNTGFVVTLEYTKDSGQTWTEITSSSATSIPVSQGDIVKFRGNNPGFSAVNSSSTYVYFTIPCECNAYGNLESLVNKENYIFLKFDNQRFCYMFKDCKIVDASGMVFRGTGRTASHMLNGAFSGCTSLIKPPTFYGFTSAGTRSFYYAFNGCTSLTDAPNLQMPVFEDYACYQMCSDCVSLTGTPSFHVLSANNWTFYNAFSNCTSITTLPQMYFGYLTTYSLYRMFLNCTGLVDASRVEAGYVFASASTHDGYCGRMFEGCTSLVYPPILPATMGRDYCYTGMFHNCTSLVNSPVLHLTGGTGRMFYEMFDGCTSLTGAPIISGLPICQYMCKGMFRGCTSLETAPDLVFLPVTSSTQYKYAFYEMFNGCSSLKYVKCLVEDPIPPSGNDDSRFKYWMGGVPATGTFVKKAGVTWPRNTSGIPAGWTVQEV